MRSGGPGKSYPANSIGLFDITSNVWELTSDLFNVNYYKQLDTSQPFLNPKGANDAYNPANPYFEEYIIKVGIVLV